MFLQRLLPAVKHEMTSGDMSLKLVAPFKKEMRDLRKILRTPVDAYLRLDELTFRRDVLMVGAPGKTHTVWSRREMWRMATKFGDLTKDVHADDAKLFRRLEKLLDPGNTGKALFRSKSGSVLRTITRYLEGQYNVRTAFPPFHARFLAHRYLPIDADGLVVDPCAGWGGRLLGSLLVDRKQSVRYIGVDPNRNNQAAYDGLLRRVRGWLKKEINGPRDGFVYSQRFEKWIRSSSAKKLLGRVDLVMTSPPYASAERYDPTSNEQSANRYRTYEKWREGFYRPLFEGAFALLRPGGVFALNVADVTGAPLESDARKLAKESGFVSKECFKLAMSRAVGTKTGTPRHSVQVDGVVWKHEPVFVFERPLDG